MSASGQAGWTRRGWVWPAVAYWHRTVSGAVHRRRLPDPEGGRDDGDVGSVADDPHFGGAMLLGGAPPSTERIVAQLTNAGYRVVWSNTAAPVDVHTAGDNFGERTDEFMRFYAPTAYMSLSTLGGSDAKQQQATLQTLVNSVTQRLDIKPFRAVIDNDLMGVGHYDRTNGRLKLNPRLVGSDTFEPSLVAVHEMRHGHQVRSSRKSAKMKRRGEPVPPQQKHLKRTSPTS